MEGQQTIDLDTDQLMAYLAGQPDVVIVYLFGSVARGQADRLSDVDLAVLLDESLGIEQRLQRQLSLMADLTNCSEREVQVALLNQASPLLAYQVITDGILLYERDRAERIAFEVNARRTYFDWKPWEDYHTQALFEDIKEVGLSGRGTCRGSALETARRIHQRLTGTPEREPG